MSEQKNQKSDQKNKRALSDIAKYSAIGFQMIAIMFIGVLAGMKLDTKIAGIEFPVFTVLLTVSSVILAIYYAIKDFIKPQK
ncbi:MAG: hypothetical protein C0597_04520 [Marinilabiliales bacterium]|nr:MAG: hypothetical protein C0597_04520 [Marinilabiliales bacterium]